MLISFFKFFIWNITKCFKNILFFTPLVKVSDSSFEPRGYPRQTKALSQSHTHTHTHTHIHTHTYKDLHIYTQKMLKVWHAAINFFLLILIAQKVKTIIWRKTNSFFVWVYICTFYGGKEGYFMGYFSFLSNDNDFNMGHLCGNLLHLSFLKV